MIGWNTISKVKVLQLSFWTSIFRSFLRKVKVMDPDSESDNNRPGPSSSSSSSPLTEPPPKPPRPSVIHDARPSTSLSVPVAVFQEATTTGVTTGVKVSHHLVDKQLVNIVEQHFKGAGNAYCDVTLACANGELIRAHKAILSTCSFYFKRVLQEPCFESSNKELLVVLSDIHYTEMKAIIDYIYNGEIEIHDEQVQEFMTTAHKLMIKGLYSYEVQESEQIEAYERQIIGGGSDANGVMRDERRRGIITEEDEWEVAGACALPI